MSVYPNVTEQDLNNFSKLSQQQKNERTDKIKNRILTQTRDTKTAESRSPITKKVGEVNKSTQKMGDVFENENNQELVPVEVKTDASEDEDTQSNIKAFPNRSNYIQLVRETLGSILRSKIFLIIEQDDFGKATNFGVPT